MIDRRGFLKNAAMTTSIGLGAGPGGVGVSSANSQTSKVSQISGSKVKNLAHRENLLSQDKIRPRGQFYDARVPDTLDLAERAELCLNSLLGELDAEHDYSFLSLRFDTNPPQVELHSWDDVPDNPRVLPLVRAMCGSDRGLDLECGVMNALLTQIDDDGVMYFPVSNPLDVLQGTSYPEANALVVHAAANWYERDRNPAWIDIIQLVCDGLEKMAIIRAGGLDLQCTKSVGFVGNQKPGAKKERAYYPLESGYGPDGVWHWTRRGEATVEYTPPDEPVLDYQGIEGAVKFEASHPMRAFLTSYQYTRDKKSLDMARRLAGYLLKPGMWKDTGIEGYLGNEHGVFLGHFRNNTTTLIHLLDLAVADQCDWLKQFVREGYDHARRNGVTRMGWFPSWVMPQNCGRPEILHRNSKADDMPMFAVKLSDAGLGDYWDDVDYYVRNQFIEQQVVSLELMRQVSGGGKENDELLKRFLGMYSYGLGPTGIVPSFEPAEAPQFALPLYYAWHGITRLDKGVATVNLFLNRASAWMDVDSYLPYEGRVILHNKAAHTALVRIPVWVETKGLKCFVSESPVEAPMSGRYLIFGNLKTGDTIRLEFPVPEWQDQYTIDGARYTMSFRGSTIVDIQPRTHNPKLYPSYRRDHLKATTAPVKTTKRFVAERLLPLP